VPEPSTIGPGPEKEGAATLAEDSDMRDYKTLAVLGAIFLFLMVLMMLARPAKPVEEADFFECPPDNHLVACKPGTTLTGCEAVGDGVTTRKLVDCQ
jgi:hypothetical protein